MFALCKHTVKSGLNCTIISGNLQPHIEQLKIAMRNVPLNLQILAPPLVLALPIIATLVFTLIYLDDISEQNDIVREWARATDQLKIAKSANYQMLSILNDISKLNKSDNSEKKEELFFNYIEQSRFLKTSLSSADISDKVPAADLSFFTSTLKNTQYSESMNIPQAILALQKLSPKLDYIYNTLQAKKRGLYIQSNQDITKITSNLTQLILIILGLTTFIAIIIAILVSRNLRKRLSKISQFASNILNDETDKQNLLATTQSNDELDAVAIKLNKMALRLGNAIDSSRILQAAEDERQRIAMDIHDQFLSEVTQLRRSIDKSQPVENYERQLNTIENTLGRLNTDLRSLINDLFPHSLDMLGLEASLRDFTSRKISPAQNIEFYIQVDDNIDTLLSKQQCLHIYRISIEAINNILKHAHCNRFELVLKIINHKLILTIEDNGCGFDFKQTVFHGNMGMLSIKQRASILGSEVIWQASRFSSGTCLKIVMDDIAIDENSLSKHYNKNRSENSYNQRVSER